MLPYFTHYVALGDSMSIDLYPALDALGKGYEIIFINDGSQDRSTALLREQFQKRPDVTASSCSTATTASTWR